MLAAGKPVMKLEGRIGRETNKAIQFTLLYEDGTEETTWFPLSQVQSIHRTHSVVNETNDSLVISMWIAKLKDLVEHN